MYIYKKQNHERTKYSIGQDDLYRLDLEVEGDQGEYQTLTKSGSELDWLVRILGRSSRDLTLPLGLVQDNRTPEVHRDLRCPEHRPANQFWRSTKREITEKVWASIFLAQN